MTVARTDSVCTIYVGSSGWRCAGETRGHCRLAVAGRWLRQGEVGCQAYRLSRAVKSSLIISKQARESISSGVTCVRRDGVGPNNGSSEHSNHMSCLRDPWKLPHADHFLRALADSNAQLIPEL